jgi:hypothetical protein
MAKFSSHESVPHLAAVMEWTKLSNAYVYKNIKELNQSKNVVYHLQDYLEICWVEILILETKLL